MPQVQYLCPYGTVHMHKVEMVAVLANSCLTIDQINFSEMHNTQMRVEISMYITSTAFSSPHVCILLRMASAYAFPSQGSCATLCAKHFPLHMQTVPSLVNSLYFPSHPEEETTRLALSRWRVGVLGTCRTAPLYDSIQHVSAAGPCKWIFAFSHVPIAPYGGLRGSRLN